MLTATFPFCVPDVHNCGFTGPFETKSMSSIFPFFASTFRSPDKKLFLAVMAGPLKIIGSWMLTQIPLERIGTPEDVAGTTLYLASRAGAWVNGATILLDGGVLASPATGKPKL